MDARENHALVGGAVTLYQEFFSRLLALDRRGVEHLLAVPPQEERREWSAGWVREHLYQTLYDFISRQSLLSVHGEFHALTEPGIRLVQADTCEQRKKLAALCRQIKGVSVPEGETDWCTVLGNYGLSEKLCITVRSALEGASDILARGLCPEADPASWLAALYDLGMEAEGTAIRAGEFSLFPSQDSEDLASGRLYSAREIFRDPGIPELLAVPSGGFRRGADRLYHHPKRPGVSRPGIRPAAGLFQWDMGIRLESAAGHRAGPGAV